MVWIPFKTKLKLLIFLRNLFRGQGGFDISKCAWHTTHEETVYSGTENTIPSLLHLVLGQTISMR
jgi:hypothetical protein